MENFCSSLGVIKITRQATDWRKYSQVAYITNKNVYNNWDKQSFKLAFEWTLHEGRYTNTVLKQTCSPWLIIREMKIESTVSHYYNPWTLDPWLGVGTEERTGTCTIEAESPGRFLTYHNLKHDWVYCVQHKGGAGWSLEVSTPRLSAAGRRKLQLVVSAHIN